LIFTKKSGNFFLKNLFFISKGKIICDSGLNDEWLFVVKSGKCRVLKRVKLNSETEATYKTATMQSKRSIDFHKYETVNSTVKSKVLRNANANMDSANSSLSGSSRPSSTNLQHRQQRMAGGDHQGKVSFLELFKMKEGDIYGLQDLILNRNTDNKPSPAILVSEGAECILIHKRYFMEFMGPSALIKLRFLVTPYPSDDRLVTKYFHSLAWQDFKTDSFVRTVGQVNRREKGGSGFKSTSMFNLNMRF
jgi:hypothetical protein